jgi:hypothetical protein
VYLLGLLLNTCHDLAAHFVVVMRTADHLHLAQTKLAEVHEIVGTETVAKPQLCRTAPDVLTRCMQGDNLWYCGLQRGQDCRTHKACSQTDLVTAGCSKYVVRYELQDTTFILTGLLKDWAIPILYLGQHPSASSVPVLG